jgi:23S rRNA (guanosine2251-2'-O)-methyltransferase
MRDLARAMDDIKERGVWLVGTAEPALSDAELTGALGLVMGGEGRGFAG